MLGSCHKLETIKGVCATICQSTAMMDLHREAIFTDRRLPLSHAFQLLRSVFVGIFLRFLHPGLGPHLVEFNTTRLQGLAGHSSWALPIRIMDDNAIGGNVVDVFAGYLDIEDGVRGTPG